MNNIDIVYTYFWYSLEIFFDENQKNIQEKLEKITISRIYYMTALTAILADVTKLKLSIATKIVTVSQIIQNSVSSKNGNFLHLFL